MTTVKQPEKQQPAEHNAPAPRFGAFFDRRFYDPVTPRVARVSTGHFVNVYLVGVPGSSNAGGDGRAEGSDGDASAPWVLVDAAVPGAEEQIQRAAEARYGAGARPEAIVLTHGHGDHAGAAAALADQWEVPVYAHRRELPFLTGRSAYPPPDPTVGGPLALLSRVMTPAPFDLGSRVEALPGGGSQGSDQGGGGRVPGLPGWRWVPVPGHAPGQVALFEPATRTLLAGDAVATTDLDRWRGLALRRRRLSRPPAPFTPDWPAAQESVRRLAALRPRAIAAGHGLPMRDVHAQGASLAADLERLARTPMAPPAGRYASHAPEVDAEAGVTHLPPPADDPLPRRVASAAGAAGTAALLWAFWQRRQR